jgi:DNA modification methylase
MEVVDMEKVIESTDLERLSLNIGGIEDRSPAGLKPWPDNPRTHSDKQLLKLKASIVKFGFTAPVIIDEAGVILSGHGRVQAAIGLELPTVPVRVITGLSEAKKRAYVIADNKLAQLSKWDEGLLKSELDILIRQDFDIELTGFSTAEIDIMFEEVGAPSPADTDEVQPADITNTVVSQRGDLWQLGHHLLYCGDALDPEAYENLMRGEQAQMVITDPPYNVAINGHVCGSGDVKHREFLMASGEMDKAEFIAFLSKAFSNIHTHVAESAIIYSFMDWRHIWNYPGVNTFKGNSHKLLALHPTVKPVSMIADAMRDCSHRKGLVLDPFSGSGTILLAAERTGRYARAIELDPVYVDVAIARWQRVTGKQAIHIDSGQTW